jgi:hypothetical protein
MAIKALQGHTEIISLFHIQTHQTFSQHKQQGNLYRIWTVFIYIQVHTNSVLTTADDLTCDQCVSPAAV